MAECVECEAPAYHYGLCRDCGYELGYLDEEDQPVTR